MVPLDLQSLGEAGVSFYTANLHKWCCAAKGTAILWARADRAADLHPLVISHFYGDGLDAEFDWQGTRDLAAWLSAPDAITYMASLDWNRVRAHNHVLATWAHAMLCARFDVEPISPLGGALLGSMATARLPAPLSELDVPAIKKLQHALYTDHQIEVPLVPWNGGNFLRVSCQIYNVVADYERLADAVMRIASR